MESMDAGPPKRSNKVSNRVSLGVYLWNGCLEEAVEVRHLVAVLLAEFFEKKQAVFGRRRHRKARKVDDLSKLQRCSSGLEVVV